MSTSKPSIGSNTWRRWLVAGVVAISALVPLAASAQAPQAITKGQRLFIAGHSFHVFICAPLETLAKEAGLTGHTTYGVQFIGNSTPMQHWNQGTDESNLAKRALRTGMLDVFTLSPNATMPEDAIDKFADLAVRTNPNIRVLVQQSWAAFDGNAPSVGARGGAAPSGRGRIGTPNAAADPPLPEFPVGCPARGLGSRGDAGAAGATAARGGGRGAPPAAGAAPTPAGFQNTDRDTMTAADIAQRRTSADAYMARFRAQLEAINSRHRRQLAFIVPAGEAVYRLREQVIAGKVAGITKQSELFADAMGHAGPVVSDLVTYVWFATMYQRTPVGLTSLDRENTATSRARHQLLQQIAWQTVRDEPQK